MNGSPTFQAVAETRGSPHVDIRRRIRWADVLLVAGCVVAFSWDALLMNVMTTRLHMNDFGKFYYSTRAFLEGRDMYAPSLATQLPFAHMEDWQFLNMNPPHFHLIVLPLALLAPKPAVMIWMSLSLVALVLSMFWIANEVGFTWTSRRVLGATFGALAFAGTGTFFLTGQLSLLLLLAITVCWIDARRGRWNRAAICLGTCVSMKPFLLIFLPYLLGTRRFRTACVMAASGVACFAIGVAIFGLDSYQSWYRAMQQSSDWAFATMNGSALGVFSRIFVDNPSSAAIIQAPHLVRWWLVLAAVVGAVTLALAVRDLADRSIDRAFALLLVGAILISPLGWIYYLWLPAGPIAAVVMTDRRPLFSLLSLGSTGLVVIAAGGLFWPTEFTTIGQPSGWATVTIASCYFWSTAAVWVWLSTRKQPRLAAGVSRPMVSVTQR